VSACLATGLGSPAEPGALRRTLARWRGLPPNLRGALLVTLAALGFTLVWTLAKLLAAHGIHPLQIAAGRAVFSLLALVPFLLRGGRQPFRTKHPWLHLTRAICGATAVLLGFYALAALPLAEVTALGFTAPLFTVLFAALLLRERVGRRRLAALAAGFLGVLVILEPGTASLRAESLLAIGSAMLIAFAITLVKRFPQSESQSVLLFTVLVASILVCGPPAVFVWTPMTSVEWLMLAGIGLSGLCAHSLFIYGFRVGESSFVAPFDYSKLVFATGGGILVFAELPGVNTLLGALVIVGATVYIAHREARLARAERSSGSKRPQQSTSSHS